MTLDEAIKRLGDNVLDYIPEKDVISRNAVELGIEALKQIRNHREYGYLAPIPPLPGETKD